MLEAMMSAEVGDDVFQADPSVNQLQDYAAQLFQKEAALFCPSGTMTNQIAVKCHTQPMDELICDYTSHVYQYENGGYSFNSGVAIQLLHGDGGKLTPELVAQAFRPSYDWLPNSRLVTVENSINKAGGNVYTLQEMSDLSITTRKLGMAIHLDGARIFNALIETNNLPSEIGPLFDSVSICLSKGLGAPVGSLLLGNQEFIAKARKWRKAMGGGMRQAGYLAAAGMYALKNHMPYLKLDNDRAKLLGKELSKLTWVERVLPVHTNIVIFEVHQDLGAAKVVDALEENGIQCVAFGPNSVRFVTHLDLTEQDLEQAVRTLNELQFS